MPPPPCVLVIEDDHAHRELVRAVVASGVAEVEFAPTLFDALEILQGHPTLFDVVVVDLGLPDGDGTTALQHLLESTPAPVVVFSGTDDPDVPARSIELGAAAFVHKDRPDQLLETIVAATGTSRPAPEPSLTSLEGSEPFERSIRATLEFLAAHVPMGVWLCTRAHADDWLVLDAEGGGLPLGEGTRLRWSDSICARMAEGGGPRVAVDVTAVPAYTSAPITRTLRIRSYIGAPIRIDDGIFGTLCGIDGDVADAALADAEPLVSHLATMLGAALELDVERDRLARALELAKLASRTDAMTGLGNRRAFEVVLSAEEVRAKRYGHPVAVVVLDLDGLKEVNDTKGHAEGDRLILAAADALTSAIRAADSAFRLGGDEFAVIAPRCPQAELDQLVDRICEVLDDTGVRAAVGGAAQNDGEPLSRVVARADERMYELKRATAEEVAQ